MMNNPERMNAEEILSLFQVDFPFRVTEKEHDIIHLKPKPLAPILLLGRSGTGKTTCCLYRMWHNFLHYWQLADKQGPLIDRMVCYVQTKQGKSLGQKPF